MSFAVLSLPFLLRKVDNIFYEEKYMSKKNIKKRSASQTLSRIWLWSQFLWDYCWNTPYLRFLNIGFVNLAFLLGIGLVFDYYLRGIFPTFLIALLVSLFHVTFSFISRKIFIYKTRRDWLKEYVRCLLLYGGSILIYSFLMWLFVDGLHMYFFVAQIFSLLSGKIYYTLASYVYFMPKVDYALKRERQDSNAYKDFEIEPINNDIQEERKELTEQKKSQRISPLKEKEGFAPFVFVRKQKELFFQSFEDFQRRKKDKN